MKESDVLYSLDQDQQSCVHKRVKENIDSADIWGLACGFRGFAETHKECNLYEVEDALVDLNDQTGI